MAQRINWIDWSKSLCMFLVILGHTHIDDSGLMVKKIIYTFHMPLFFFISGLLCKYQVSKQSLIRDAKYILFPYFIFGILGIFIPHPRPLQDVDDYLYNLFTGFDSSIGAIWFLPAIFICKQVGTVIICIQHHCKWLFHVVVAFTLFIPYIINDVNLPFFTSSALLGIPFFLMGHFFMKYFHSLSSSQSQLSYVYLLIFLVSTIITIILSNRHEYVVLANHSYGDNVIYYYLNAIIGISSVLSISMLFNKLKLYFVTVTSYGSISIIWIHGVYLSFFHYHMFRLLHIEISTYSIELATFFSVFTYIGSFITVIICDKYCPFIFGLKGNLSKDK